MKRKSKEYVYHLSVFVRPRWSGIEYLHERDFESLDKLTEYLENDINTLFELKTKPKITLYQRIRRIPQKVAARLKSIKYNIVKNDNNK